MTRCVAGVLSLITRVFSKWNAVSRFLCFLHSTFCLRVGAAPRSSLGLLGWESSLWLWLIGPQVNQIQRTMNDCWLIDKRMKLVSQACHSLASDCWFLQDQWGEMKKWNLREALLWPETGVLSRWPDEGLFFIPTAWRTTHPFLLWTCVVREESLWSQTMSVKQTWCRVQGKMWLPACRMF